MDGRLRARPIPAPVPFMNRRLRLAVPHPLLLPQPLHVQMMVDTINQFPNEAAFINTVRKMWILRRAIVRAAERTCFANGKNFRGRFNPIYAKEITLQKTAKVRRATVLFSRNEGLMTRASSPCTPASNASKAALRRLSTAFVSKGRKGRRDKSPAGGSPRKSNNHFNVTDNSAERKAQMLAGNVATASASSVGTSVSDDRIQRLEDGFVRLESKLDQLLSASLGLPPPSQPLPLAAASTGSENHLASSLLSRWTESAETFKKVLQVPSREGSQKSHPPGGALEA